jgi:hypothetical protein
VSENPAPRITNQKDENFTTARSCE